MTSPSTLIRQAKATKDKRAASKLRAKAAKMRRSIRAVKGAGDRPNLVTETIKRTIYRPGEAGYAEVAARLPAGTMVATHDETKGWTVKGQGGASQSEAYALAHPLIPADRIAFLRKLALKRDPGSFEIQLRSLFVDGKVAARDDFLAERMAASRANVDQLKAMVEASAIKVVSSFMARIKGMEAGNQPLPASFVLDGYTAARIYDALRDAGYTTEGKQGGIRKAG